MNKRPLNNRLVTLALASVFAVVLHTAQAQRVAVANRTYLRLMSSSVVKLDNLKVQSGGTAVMESGSYLSVAAALTNSGTLRCNVGSTVNFVAGTQNLTGPTAFSNLMKSGGGTLTLNSPTTVDGTLQLSSGKITLGTNNLTIGASGSISGASPTNFIVTNGAGLLQQTVGGSDVLFPIGPTETSYDPATIRNAGTSDVFSGRVQPAFDNPPLDPNAVVNRQWTINEAVPGGSNATLMLQWNAADEGSGFIRSKPISIGSYSTKWNPIPAVLADLGGSVFSATASGFSSFLAFTVVSGDYIAPAAPQNLTATAGAGEVMLRWNKNAESDFLGYRIYGGSSANPTTLLDSNNSVIDTTALITGLTNGTAFYFRIAAVDSALNVSGYSNEVSATPNAIANASTQPADSATGLTPVTITFSNLIQNGTTQLHILSSITPPPPPLIYQLGNPATYYEISTTAVFSGTVSICVNYTGVSYVKESKLKLLHRVGSTWVNTTTALDTANNVICGNVTSLSPFVIIEPETVPPMAPINLTATASSSVDRRIDLRWTASSSDDVTGYLLYRSNASITDTTGKLLALIGRATSFADVVQNYSTYFYRIFAHDSVGNVSPASNETSAKAPDHLAPAVPRSLAVTDSSCKTLKITWLKNLETDFLRYRVYRGTSPEPSTKMDSTTGGNADTSKTFVGLTNGTRYYFRVTAVDSAGNESAYSNEVSATPVDREPPVITLAQDPIVLWPPNHQYRTIKVSDFVLSVTDACAGELPVEGVVITKVTSDEPEDVQGKNNGKSDAGGGDGSTLQDIVINAGCQSVSLRSERLGGGNGRVYTIHVAVRDPSYIGGGGGNLATATFVVQVPHDKKHSIAVDDGVAYSVTSSCEGSFTAHSATSSEESAKPSIPSEFSLEQNYPNPFNPSTIIRYGLPERSTVKLQIFDLLGRAVTTLVNGEQDARYYEVSWQANVPSGIYFYRIVATAVNDPSKRFVQVRKMLVLK